MKKLLALLLILAAPIIMVLDMTNPGLFEADVVRKSLFLSGFFYSAISVLVLMPVMIVSSKALEKEQRFTLLKTVYNTYKRKEAPLFFQVLIRLFVATIVLAGFFQYGSYSILVGGFALVLSSRLSKAMSDGIITGTLSKTPILEQYLQDENSKYEDVEAILRATGHRSNSIEI